VGALGASTWLRDGGDPWYLELEPPPPAVRPWSVAQTCYAFVCNVGRFFLLTYQFIPVSLYVSISMVSSINAYFVGQDLQLYDAGEDEPCVVRSMALLEELGQVTHIFSDKTGTLTSNHMQFRCCYIAGVAYGTGDTTISAFLSDQARRNSLGWTPNAAQLPLCAPGVSAPPASQRSRGPPGPSIGSAAATAGLGACRTVTQAYVSYEEEAGSPSLLGLLLRAAPGARRSLLPDDAVVLPATLPPPESEAGGGGHGWDWGRWGGDGRGAGRVEGRGDGHGLVWGGWGGGEGSKEGRGGGRADAAGGGGREGGGEGGGGIGVRAAAEAGVGRGTGAAGGGGGSAGDGGGGGGGLDGISTAASAARDFFVHLALNHSVMPETVGGQADLCASSPDELAFVSAAEYFGIEFTTREAGQGLVLLTERVSGRVHRVELLDVFPYESSRKRMSVVVRLPLALLPESSTCREVLYTKGADSVLLSSLAPGHDSSLIEHAEATLQGWSEMALRTLVFCRRELPFFAEWRARYDLAQEDADGMRAFRSGEACVIARLQAELEMNLCFQGATAVEDKLQEGVPEALADLRAANVKVWMLTGDKVGTAKNIAAACNILPAGIQPLEITEDACPPLKSLTTADLLKTHYAHCALLGSPADDSAVAAEAGEAAYEAAVTADLEPRFPVVRAVRLALEARVADMEAATRTGAGPSSHSLVLDEKAIELCGMVMPGLLATVADGARSVVACRARKDQKAQLLQLIRRRVPGSVCLAIGDGANDVAMLRAAHVGVGIIGKEGAQAVNSSDFAIGQFRFLRRLMFVHGRNSYRRLPVLIYYIFYKNILETLVQYWFTTQAGWSGETPYVQIVINWFNMFYTAAPILAYAINDADLPPFIAEHQPRAYAIGVQARWYSHSRFWRWQAEAVLASLLALFIPLCGLSTGSTWAGIGAGGMRFLSIHTSPYIYMYIHGNASSPCSRS